MRDVMQRDIMHEHSPSAWGKSFARTMLRCGLFALTFALAFAQQNATAARQEVPDNPLAPSAPAQPLPFSHKTHIARNLQCRACHTNPEPGVMMTFPAVATCMGCHNNVAKDHAAIQKLAEFARSGQPIPWVRVYQVTSGVMWTHRKHLNAGMQCVMCHGNVGQLDAMAQTTAVTTMASCISCHQSHNAPVVCATCHAWPAEQTSN
jgi:hypothetical protein